MRERIAIIGGSGYVGLELGRHLSSSFHVRVLDRTPPESLLREGLDFRRIDVRDLRQVVGGLRNVDLVIHTAIIQIPKINEEKKQAYETNILGIHNVCGAVDKLSSPKGLLLAGSWHVFGEQKLTGVIDEEFGFRPDKVEPRARLYALSKITQESIVRFYNEMSPKAYGVIRMGTVLGERMPKETAANIFIEQALNGQPMTPFAHIMHRPMLYVDVRDVCRGFESFAKKILGEHLGHKEGKALGVVNLVWPEPITIIELAETVKMAVIENSGGKLNPQINIVDKGLLPLYTPKDKRAMTISIEKARTALGISELTDPRDTINKIVKTRLASRQTAKQ